MQKSSYSLFYYLGCFLFEILSTILRSINVQLSQVYYFANKVELKWLTNGNSSKKGNMRMRRISRIVVYALIKLNSSRMTVSRSASCMTWSLMDIGSSFLSTTQRSHQTTVL